jgi:hypothetical protein
VGYVARGPYLRWLNGSSEVRGLSPTPYAEQSGTRRGSDRAAADGAQSQWAQRVGGWRLEPVGSGQRSEPAYYGWSLKSESGGDGAQCQCRGSQEHGADGVKRSTRRHGGGRRWNDTAGGGRRCQPLPRGLGAWDDELQWRRACWRGVWSAWRPGTKFHNLQR